MAKSLVRGIVASVACLAVGTVVGASSFASAASILPDRDQLSSAMLTFGQMKRIGLEPLSGDGAVYSGDFDPDLAFSTRGHVMDSYTFADSSSAGNRDARSIMMTASFGLRPTKSVMCRIDEGSPEVAVGQDACVSVRDLEGDGTPDTVSYGIKPAPGVNVIATVGAEPVSTRPSWSSPRRAAMVEAARRLAVAQVARLRSRGLLGS